MHRGQREVEREGAAQVVLALHGVRGQRLLHPCREDRLRLLQPP